MWASAFVAIRALAGTFSPGSITVGRFLVGVVVLAVIARPRSRPTMSRGDLVAVVAAGVLFFGLYSLGLNAGEREVDAGTAVLLVNIGPILIALFAGLFLREGISPQLIAGCVIAFFGVSLVAASSSETGATGPSARGVAIVLGATVAYAAAATLQRRVLRRVDGSWVNMLGIAAALVLCLPLFGGDLARELSQTTPGQWLPIVYLGVFPTAIGFTTWAYALARTSAGRTAAVMYLQPPIAIALSWLLLGELPALLAIIGGAICVGGVALARSKSLPVLAARSSRAASDT
jgi:drug/metabolite transporter (DMT)-like permease